MLIPPSLGEPTELQELPGGLQRTVSEKDAAPVSKRFTVHSVPEPEPIEAKKSAELPAKPVTKKESQAKESAPLPDSWLSAQKSKREIPAAARKAIGGAVALIVFVFAMPKMCGSDSQDVQHSAMIEPTGETGADLKKRRHLTDEDFRGRATLPAQVRQKNSPPPEPSEIDLEERRRLRENNSEDIRSQKTRRRRPRPQVRQIQPHSQGSMFQFFNRPGESREYSGHSLRRQERQAPLLLSAGSSLRIQLARDIVVRGGRSTAMATIAAGEPHEGSKLIGRAQLTGDAITVRFDTLVLPSGRSIRVSAEAIDSSGATALAAHITGGRQQHSQPGAARSIGVDTAGRVAGSVLGTGILGGIAQQSLSEANRPRYNSQSTAKVGTVAKETALLAFFSREVREK